MGAERYVVLGLAHPRSEWFRAVTQWANSAALPAEFVKCLSGEELRARLASGRPFSAVLVDAGLPAIDRDLVDRAHALGCAVLVVADGRAARDWAGLGVAALLPVGFGRQQLLDALVANARPIGRCDVIPGDVEPPPAEPDPRRGRIAAVCGSGGTGVSTVAIALAQGLAGAHRVVLADLAHHAEQAMLHDTRDIVPGLQELVDAHRSARPRVADVEALTFDIGERGYHLLLGLRRGRFWATLRPRALSAGIDSLTAAYQVVVCDCDADLEGADDCGSVEVEERNLLARTAIGGADVVFAVGLPTMKGLYSLVRVLHDLVAFGVPAPRIVPVLNRSARQPAQRAVLARSLAQLAHASLGDPGVASPLFLPERRIEEALRDGVRLPTSLAQPLRGAFIGVTAAAGRRTIDDLLPARVLPGTLGSWTDHEAVG